jgi:hypothetical protein
MMNNNLVQQEVLSLLPPKRKNSSRWISFNAVCCSHNGESADTRGRGGMLPNADGSVSYHCFNCGFKTGFYPGRPLGFKFRKLLKWLGADDNTVQRLVMEALRLKESMPADDHAAPPPVDITFNPRALPQESVSIAQLCTVIRLKVDYDKNGLVQESQLLNLAGEQLIEAAEYLHARRIQNKYDFYLTADTSYNLHRRVIVPFYWRDQLIGYTARAVAPDVKPKYHSNYEPNYVFNTNMQQPNAKFVLVVEGPFDAMAVDGVATLSNDISETQAEIIEDLGRDIIVVPDFDRHVDKRGKEVWPGEALVNRAIEYGWAVSFPVWREDPECKDVADAVKKYGKLFVLKSIIDAVEKNPVKIKLKSKQ